MKKNVLITLMALFAISFTANADITGIYIDDLNVTITAGEEQETLVLPTISDQEITLEAGESNTYILKLEDFEILVEPEDPYAEPMYIGDIIFDEIIATENADGSVTLTRPAGETPGPIVYEVIETFIELVSGSISPDGEMLLHLTVRVPEFPGGMTVTVLFGSEPTNLVPVFSDKKALKIIYTTANEITVQGADNENYTIYNAKGMVVNSGKLTNATVNISALVGGIYILNVNGASAKFIKK